jgi:DNA-binding PadR family transcriptional regulator
MEASGVRTSQEGGLDLGKGQAVNLGARSSVARAVLGSMLKKPRHDYEIDQRFGGVLGVGRALIYSGLSTLMETDLIEKMSGRSTTAVRRGAKARATYRATARGAGANRRWQAEQVLNDPRRAEMLGRLTTAGVHSVEAALDFIERYKEECVREAQDLAGPGASANGEKGLSSLLERLLIEERRQMIEAQLAWANYARAELLAVKSRSLSVEQLPLSREVD